MSLSPSSSLELSTIPAVGRQPTPTEATPTTPRAPRSHTVVKYRSELDVGNSDELKTPTLKDMLKLVPFPAGSMSGLDLLPPPVHASFSEFQTESGHHVMPGRSNEASGLQRDAMHHHRPKPLDLRPLVSPEQVHLELTRTTNDLSKWLAIVEKGLADILEKSSSENNGRSIILESLKEEENSFT